MDNTSGTLLKKYTKPATRSVLMASYDISIKMYQPANQQVSGTVILVPGLATNTDTYPLMQSCIHQALKYNYNVITIDHFLGNFINNDLEKKATENTYKKFVDILQTGFKYIEPYIENLTSCLIGHSAGAIGSVDAMNNMTQNKEQIKFTFAVLLAPWISESWPKHVEKVISARLARDNINIDASKYLPFANIHKKGTSSNCVPVTPQLLTDITTTKFQPNIMALWHITIIIMVGENDKCAKPDMQYERYQILKNTCDDKTRVVFALIPNANHSFNNVPNIAEFINTGVTR